MNVGLRMISIYQEIQTSLNYFFHPLPSIEKKAIVTKNPEILNLFEGWEEEMATKERKMKEVSS